MRVLYDDKLSFVCLADPKSKHALVYTFLPVGDAKQVELLSERARKLNDLKYVYYTRLSILLALLEDMGYDTEIVTAGIGELKQLARCRGKLNEFVIEADEEEMKLYVCVEED